MSAKSKSSDSDNSIDPYLPSKDPELEKKVDLLMSVETPETSPEPVVDAPRTTIPVVDVSTPDSLIEVGGVPLLPTDKLPNLAEKKAVPKKPVELPEEPTEPDPATESVESVEPVAETEETEQQQTFELPTDSQPTKEDESYDPQLLPKPVAPMESESSTDVLGLDEPSTGQAIDEIIAADADELLIARDRNFAEQDPANSNVKAGKKPRKRTAKSVIIGIILLILISVGAAAAFPATRYLALNKSGVRSASSVTILDDTTGQPLKNVIFSVAGVSSKTDAEGKARVEQLKLGPTTMTIKKPAFAEVSQPVTIGWGSNPLGEYKIKAIGIQYKFLVTDFLSKKPIAKVEVTSGQAAARSNEKGEVVLTLPEAESDTIKVQVSAEGYRPEIIEAVSITKETRSVPLTPSRKHVFISKRGGTLDVYKIDVDGKNEVKVLAGTGKERSESIALSTHPSKNIAALVSSREAGVGGKPSPSTLTIINLDDNSSAVVIKSERVQLVDWVGSKLIYVKVADGQPDDSPSRHRLVSYDVGSKTERELASSNYFNDVVAANGSIYYSPAAYQASGAVGLYKINAEGNYKKTIYDKEVWNLFRTAYDKLVISIGQEWFDLNVDTDLITKTNGPPPVMKSRVYFDNPDNTSSLWIDERDGKGVMLSYDHSKKEDTILVTQSGLKNPVRWLDNQRIIYRVNTSQETADYIFSTDGGQPKKIRDVTDTAGIDRWYYY